MSEQTVSIFFPTYRNCNVFSYALNSVLDQSYQSLEVIIYDNSLADGFPEIRQVVEQRGDPRVEYIANPVNVGSIANYQQIFRHAQSKDWCIVLPSDCGLQINAVEIMMDTAFKFGASWVRTDITAFPVEAIDSAASQARLRVPHSPGSVQTCHSNDVLLRYFSRENIDGEFDWMTWGGSLICGSIWRSVDFSDLPFRWHGGEQYIGMEMLVGDFTVAVVPLPLEIDIHGAIRFGTERPENDFTRLETILATQEVLRRHRTLLAKIAPLQAERHQIEAITRFLRLRRGHRIQALRMLLFALFHRYAPHFTQWHRVKREHRG